MSTKVAEAEELLKKAEKCMKTSLLKWKPDTDSAIDYYAKAAVCYRNARQLQSAIGLYKKIGDLHLESNGFFHAAKSYEQGALLCKELKDYPQMANLIQRAGQLFRENGTPDTASLTYEKAAKALEDPLPEKAAEFYEKSSDAAEIEDKFRQAAEQSGQAARMWTRLRRLPEAEAALRSKADLCIREEASDVAAKAVVALVLLHLYRDDFVAARKIYEYAIDKWGFSRTDDAGPVTQLLSAIEESDGAAARRVLAGPTFKYIENEYVKLARDIKLPPVEDAKGNVTSGVAVSGASHDDSHGNSATTAGDEDEEDPNVC